MYMDYSKNSINLVE